MDLKDSTGDVDVEKALTDWLKKSNENPTDILSRLSASATFQLEYFMYAIGAAIDMVHKGRAWSKTSSPVLVPRNVIILVNVKPDMTFPVPLITVITKSAENKFVWTCFSYYQLGRGVSGRLAFDHMSEDERGGKSFRDLLREYEMFPPKHEVKKYESTENSVPSDLCEGEGCEGESCIGQIAPQKKPGFLRRFFGKGGNKSGGKGRKSKKVRKKKRRRSVRRYRRHMVGRSISRRKRNSRKSRRKV